VKRLIHFGRDVVNGWLEAEAFTRAASLAYYFIKSKLFSFTLVLAAAFLLLVSLLPLYGGDSSGGKFHDRFRVA
jgi:hypothetical protein